MGRLSGRFALAATLLLIALATLVPLGQAPARVSAVEWPDLIVNLCLFLPLGLLLALRGQRLGRIALLALLLSAGIELLQATLISGRRGTLVDVLTNLAGALAGALLWRSYQALRGSGSPARMGLAAAAALAVPVVGWLACGLLLAPRPPSGSGDWWGQWAHSFEDTEPFRGSIRSVEFLGRPVPDARIDATEALREEARKGILTFEVTLRSGGTALGPTHLASVASSDGIALIGLDQQGDDLLLRWRSRGARLGLRRPQLTFPGLLHSDFGDSLTITARVTRNRASVTVARGGELRPAVRRLTVLTGWRSLIPTRGLSAREQRLFDLIWTLGLAGYLVLSARVLRSLRVSARRPARAA